MPKHRGIEYRVIQAVQPRSWTWEIILPELGIRSGLSGSKLEAVRAAERTIEKFLADQGKRPVPHTGNPPPLRAK